MEAARLGIFLPPVFFMPPGGDFASNFPGEDLSSIRLAGVGSAAESCTSRGANVAAWRFANLAFFRARALALLITVLSLSVAGRFRLKPAWPYYTPSGRRSQPCSARVRPQPCFNCNAASYCDRPTAFPDANASCKVDLKRVCFGSKADSFEFDLLIWTGNH